MVCVAILNWTIFALYFYFGIVMNSLFAFINILNFWKFSKDDAICAKLFHFHDICEFRLAFFCKFIIDMVWCYFFSNSAYEQATHYIPTKYEVRQVLSTKNEIKVS